MIYIPDQAASTNEYVQNFMDTLYTKYCHKINNYKMNWKKLHNMLWTANLIKTLAFLRFIKQWMRNHYVQ